MAGRPLQLRTAARELSEVLQFISEEQTSGDSPTMRSLLDKANSGCQEAADVLTPQEVLPLPSFSPHAQTRTLIPLPLPHQDYTHIITRTVVPLLLEEAAHPCKPKERPLYAISS